MEEENGQQAGSLIGQVGRASAVAIRINGWKDALAVWDELESQGKKRSTLMLKSTIFSSVHDGEIYSQELDLMAINFKGADMRDMIIRACEVLGLEHTLTTVVFETCEYEPMTFKHVFGTPVEAAG